MKLCKYFTIICEDPDPICAYIKDRLNRSATTYEAQVFILTRERP